MQSRPDSRSLDLSNKYCIDYKNIGLIFVVYLPFRINTENLIKNKLYISREYHLQFSEIDKLPYYEYEIVLEEINAIAKKQEKENEKQSQGLGNLSPEKYAKSMQNSMNNFKMPTVSMPKI